jgi:hypothetical protein
MLGVLATHLILEVIVGARGAAYGSRQRRRRPFLVNDALDEVRKVQTINVRADGNAHRERLNTFDAGFAHGVPPVLVANRQLVAGYQYLAESRLAQLQQHNGRTLEMRGGCGRVFWVMPPIVALPVLLQKRPGYSLDSPIMH